MQKLCATAIRQTPRFYRIRLSTFFYRHPIQHTKRLASNMSSDQDYAAFLEKANQDTGANTSSSGSKDQGYAQTKAVDTSVPGPLKDLDAFYMSESDEPFEPVAIKYKKGGDLSEDQFAKLIHHSGEVESQSLDSWNVKGQYDSVVEAVKKAASGKGDIKVFRVAHGETRCEYYVVTLNDEGVVVGVKARAVES